MKLNFKLKLVFCGKSPQLKNILYPRFIWHRIHLLLFNKVPESRLAHKLLDKLQGYEIGGSSVNPFGLKGCKFIDIDDANDTGFHVNDPKRPKVSIVAHACRLPLANESTDYIISAHVIEHIWDVIAALEEWYRVIKPSGFIYIICPRIDLTFDRHHSLTSVQTLLHRQKNPPREKEIGWRHFSYFSVRAFLDVCDYLDMTVVFIQTRDDKIGNGFTIVIQKPPYTS